MSWMAATTAVIAFITRTAPIHTVLCHLVLHDISDSRFSSQAAFDSFQLTRTFQPVFLVAGLAAPFLSHCVIGSLDWLCAAFPSSDKRGPEPTNLCFSCAAFRQNAPVGL